jgi:nucleotide-binding universal stress UspA family protein
MFKPKKILLPIDFSEPSYDSLKSAKVLAAHFSAQIFFIHVIPPLPPFAPPPKDKPGFDVSAYLKHLHLSAEKSLREVVDKTIGKELKAHFHVVNGRVAEKISRYALKHDIDLIVIASHGTSGWKSTGLGSVAERLIHISSIPTMIIRKPQKP